MARYGSRGRYWNVGLSDPGRLAATPQQTWALHVLSGRKEDFRKRGLTRAEASELIRKMGAEIDEGRKRVGGNAMQDAMFEAMMRKAARAASAAGDEWLAEHPDPVFSVYDPAMETHTPVHGAIGVAYLTWPPRKSPFGQWLKRSQGDGQFQVLRIPHVHVGRLERGLLLACEAAALRILESQGVTGVKLMMREDPSTRIAA